MKYLFLSDHTYDRRDGLQIRYHQPVKADRPVLVPDRPWEDNTLNWLLGGPIWCQDRQRWRLWYIGGRELQPLYAESIDGLNWEKPGLGRVAWNGSTDNNIIRIGMDIARGKDRRLVLIRDDREPDPARRYKGLNRVGGRLYPLASSTGFDWRLLEGRGFASDDEYRLCPDPLRKRFVATGKVLIGAERAVTLALSDDFVNWSEPEMIFRADARDREWGVQRIRSALADSDRCHPLFINEAEFFTDVYHLQVFVYEDLYLGIAALFHWSGYWPDRKNQDGLIQPVLAVSRDLRVWDRLNHEVFLPLSPRSASGLHDQGSLVCTPPVRRGDELWFYYRGGRYSHLGRDRVKTMCPSGEPDSAVHVARLRLDGFASLNAGANPGEVTTRPLTISGPQLFVNAAIRAGGTLRAELLDSEGRSLAPFTRDQAVPFTGDRTCARLEWKHGRDFSAMAGRSVRIRFTLQEGDLYAFWMAPEGFGVAPSGSASDGDQP